MARYYDDLDRPHATGPADAAVCRITFRTHETALGQDWQSDATLVSLSGDPAMARRMQALGACLALGTATARSATWTQAMGMVREPLKGEGHTRLVAIAAPSARASEVAALDGIVAQACLLVTDAPSGSVPTPPGCAGVLRTRPGESLDDTALTLLQMLAALIGPSTMCCLDVQDFLDVFASGSAQLARALWMPDGQLEFSSRADKNLLRYARRVLTFMPDVTRLGEESAIVAAVQSRVGPTTGLLRLDCPSAFLVPCPIGVRPVSVLCGE